MDGEIERKVHLQEEGKLKGGGIRNKKERNGGQGLEERRGWMGREKGTEKDLHIFLCKRLVAEGIFLLTNYEERFSLREICCTTHTEHQ